MAIAEVGSGSQRIVKTGQGDFLTQAFPGSVTAGNLLVVLGACWVSGGAPASITVTDDRSTSYTVLSAPAGGSGNFRFFIAYGIALSSGACTVTVNPAGASSDMGWVIDEFSGVDTSTPLDVDGSFTVSAVGSTTPNDDITTGVVNALVLGVMSHDLASTTITKGASYTEIGQSTSTSAAQPFSAEFRLATTASLYTVDWTLAAVRGWGVYTASFRPSTAVAPPPPMGSFGTEYHWLGGDD